jgi:pimeloyl-ACP methyl ester carboxylesterase
MLTVEYGDSQGPTQPLLVFLHGFPGLRSKQNRDLAEQAANGVSGKSFVALYSGLGQAPGQFSFSGCLLDVRGFFHDLMTKWPDRQFTLVGHSWGGLMALILASEFPSRIHSLVLLSPLLDFKGENGQGIGREEFIEMGREHPEISFGGADFLSADFDNLGKQIDIPAVIEKIPAQTQILFLQAKNDKITPESVAKQLLPHFRATVSYREIEVDHSFLGEGRSEVSRFICAHVALSQQKAMSK